MRFHRLCAAAALLATSLTLVGTQPLSATPFASARPDSFAEEAASSTLHVTVDEIAPRIFTTETSLTVNLSITNSSDSDITNPLISVNVQNQTPASLAEFTPYFSAESWDGVTVYEAPHRATIPAHKTVPVTIIIPREDLPLDDEDDWGPRGITVTVSGAAMPVHDRSLFIWDSGQDVTPAAANVVLPWTVNTLPSPLQERSILAQLSTTAGITWAVDPRVPTRRSGEESPHPDASQSEDAPQSHPLADIVPWKTAETFALLPYDAEPGLLAAVSPELLASGLHDAAQELHDISTPALRGVVWPTEAGMSTTLMAAQPHFPLLAPPATTSPRDDISFTPAPIIAVNRENGETSTIGAQDNTHTVITQFPLVNELLAWDPDSAADRTDRDQLLAAAGALFVKEDPGVSRSFVASLPRNQVLTRDSVQRLHALMKQRWVTEVPLSSILTQTPSDVERQDIPALPHDHDDQKAIDHVRHGISNIERISGIVDTPQTMDSHINQRIFSTFSTGRTPWHRIQNSLSFDNYTDSLSRGVHAESSVTVNLINKTAQFPVRVTNSLPWDVTVRVTLDPSDPRLDVTSPTQAAIPASSTATVEVPVNAIGAGDIYVAYVVSTLDGATIDRSQTVKVRLRAGWEDALTFTFSGVVALAFIGGLVRNIRRRLHSHEVPGAGGHILAGMIPVSDFPPPQEDS